LEDLYRQTPTPPSLAQNSAGVLVFPDVTKPGLIVGGNTGSRAVQGRKPAGHYNIAGGSAYQAGASFSKPTSSARRYSIREDQGFGRAGLDFAVADMGTAGDISAHPAKPLIIFVWVSKLWPA
jgi:hypothetical protein